RHEADSQHRKNVVTPVHFPPYNLYRSSYRIVRTSDVVILPQSRPTLPARRLVTSRRKKVQRDRSQSAAPSRELRATEYSREVGIESPSVPLNPVWKIVAISVAIFVVAHLALMIGLATPDKI